MFKRFRGSIAQVLALYLLISSNAVWETRGFQPCLEPDLGRGAEVRAGARCGVTGGCQRRSGCASSHSSTELAVLEVGASVFSPAMSCGCSCCPQDPSWILCMLWHSIYILMAPYQGELLFKVIISFCVFIHCNWVKNLFVCCLMLTEKVNSS